MQQNNYPKYGKKDNVNISFAGIIITLILLKLIFYGGVMSAFGAIISLIIGGILMQWYLGRSSASAENVFGVVLIDSYLDFLSPQNSKGAFKLLRDYVILGFLILSLSLFGPWFVFEGDWRHSFDDTWYDDEHGKIQSSRYGLLGVNYVSYDYSDWGDYETVSERISYNEEEGYDNRNEVASKALKTTLLAIILWTIPSMILLNTIKKRLLNTNPRIKKLKEIKHLQNVIINLSKQLERLTNRGINIASFQLKLKEIKESNNSLNLKASHIKPTTIFVFALSIICVIAMGIAAIACGQFADTWPEAIHTEVTCGRSSDATSSTTQCMTVDSFTGNFYDTSSSGSGTYHMTFNWGSGWGLQTILWLGTFAVLGVIRNSFTLLKLSEKTSREIIALEKDINEFTMPEL